MSIKPGAYTLGPSDGTVQVRTGRQGMASKVGHDLTLGIRPEHIELRKGDEGELRLTATIELLEQLGATSFLYCTLADGTKLQQLTFTGRNTQPNWSWK